MINNSNIHERLGHNKVDIISGGFMMNNKQAQFLDYILKRVQDGKVDEAQKLVNECFKKQEAGTFTRVDIGAFIPQITVLIKPNHVDEVHNVLHEFAASFKTNQE